MSRSSASVAPESPSRSNTVLELLRQVWFEAVDYRADPTTTDILIRGGWHPEVWVDQGGGVRRVAQLAGTDADIRSLAVRLAALARRRLDEAQPWVDARLPDGARLHAVLSPISPDGTQISLRIPSSAPLSLRDFVAGPDRRSWLAVVQAAMSAGLSCVVTGATGSGKTTLLSALLGLVPPTQRIVMVEDVVELRPRHQQAVHLEARQPNVEGLGGIDQRHLLRQALRMRPDWLVVGECRGAEVIDLLTALNAGHAGCATVHSRSADQLPSRLQSLGLLAGVRPETTTALLFSGVHLVVHVVRGAQGLRWLSELAVVTSKGLLSGVRQRVSGSSATSVQLGPGWPVFADLVGWAPTPTWAHACQQVELASADVDSVRGWVPA